MDDQNDLMTDVNLDVSLYLHMNDPLGDHSMDDDHRDVLVGHRMNGMVDRNDLKMVLKMGVNLCRRMNGTDDRNDLKTDGNHVNRNYAPRDLMMDASLDVSLCLRMSDRLGGHLMGANLDAMNRRVKLMVYLSKSCDRMSHDHLRCDRQMMRHRDTNRMDEKNLDGKMKIHHVSWC
jgi:hypothetical protein